MKFHNSIQSIYKSNGPFASRLDDAKIYNLSTNGRLICKWTGHEHLAVAGVRAMMPQRVLTLSNCSRSLETIALLNHVTEDKISSKNHI